MKLTTPSLPRTVSCFLRYGLALPMLLIASFGLTPSYAQSTPTAEVQRGLTWLQSQIQADGTVSTPQSTIARSTQAQAETVLALKVVTGSVPANVNSALQAVSQLTTETLARQVLSAVASNGNADAALAQLAAQQNGDGGYGVSLLYVSNPLDTSYALLALHAKPSQYADAAQKALTYLSAASSNPNGAAPALGVNQQNHVFTATHIMLSVNEWRTQFGVGAISSTAKTWLLSQRDASNHFADSQSDALTLLALLTDTRDAAQIDPLMASLKTAQLANGSWANDPYVTALAIRALYRASQPTPVATTGGVQGTVTDETTGAPITGVSVLVTQDTSQSATTGSTGVFALSNLNAGSYTLRVSKLGYQPRDINFSITAGQIANLGSIALRAAPLTASLSGVVKDSNGSPLRDVLISVGTSSALTDVAGAYQITGLNPGPATITAALTNYQTATATTTFAAGTNTVFSPTLYANGVTPSGTSLKGIVVDSVTGNPIQSATVTLNSVNKLTPADGSFEFTSLSTGSVTLAISATGYTSASFSGTLVTGANDVGKLQLVKAAATSTVSGVVRDGTTKSPVSGATVAVQGQSISATTGADGKYALPGITSTSLTLTASATNYVTRQIAVTLPQVGANSLDIELTKPASSKLSFEFVRTQKPTYEPDEVVRLEVEVKNTDTTAASLLVEADVIDAQNRVVFTFFANSRTGWAGTRLPNQPITIAAAGVLDVPMEWFMLRQAAGSYQVRARGIDANGSVVAEGQTTFSVNAAAILRGGVTPNPPLAQFGTNQAIQLSADLTNTGNIAIPPGNLDVQIVLDAPDTQTSTVPQTAVKTFASGAPLSYARGLVSDSVGNRYTVNQYDSKLLRIDPNGVVSVVATLPRGYVNNDYSKYIGSPITLALADNGDFWVITDGVGQLLRVAMSGAVTVEENYTKLNYASAIDVAANGDLIIVGRYSGADTSYQEEQRLVRRAVSGAETVLWKNGLSGPVAFAKDDTGNLVVTNYSDNTLNKVSLSTGRITPFAVGLNRPQGIVRDAAGNYYVANSGGDTIAKVTAAGIVSTYATGLAGPIDLKFDGAGNLYVSNQNNNSISKVLSNGTVETFARGIANQPQGMKYDNLGNLWI